MQKRQQYIGTLLDVITIMVGVTVLYCAFLLYIYVLYQYHSRLHLLLYD